MVEEHRQDDQPEDDQQRGQGALGAPVDRLETRISELAEHHVGQEQQQRRQREFPCPQRPSTLVKPQQQFSQRGDHSRRRRDGDALERLALLRGRRLRAVVGVRGSGDAVEARQPQRSARQVQKRDQQPRPRELVEHDLVHQQCRREAEADDVRQRIEFPPEGTVGPAEPRHPAVEHVEDAGSQDEPDGGVKLVNGPRGPDPFAQLVLGNDPGLRGEANERARDDLERRREPAKQVPGRHQVGQEVDLRIVRVRLAAGKEDRRFHGSGKPLRRR